MPIIWHVSEEVWADRPGDKFSTILKEMEDVRTVEYKYNKDSDFRFKYQIDSITNSSGAVYPWMGPNIIHGPIRFVNEILRQVDDAIVVTDFKDNLKVSDYMSLYPLEWFLNSDGYFTTYGILSKNLINSPVFIRPNSPFKTFTGLGMDLGNFKSEMSSLQQIQNVRPEEIILVASRKEIQSEYRCVVIDRKVVTYSEYRWDNILDIRRDILPECLALAERVAAYPYQLDDAYVVDVCMTEAGPRIVEFNSFSSSGMYACDLELIVEAMNGLARRIWNENRGL
jgi:hypothetical protein